MTTRPLTILGLLLFAGCAALFTGCAAPPPERPKNILLLSVDTLRADSIGAAGYAAARTPTIDRLAAEGTYFTSTIAPMPRTTPALGSLLTGLWPHRHGSREVGDPIVDEAPTLAEILSHHGFHTRAVVANGSAGPKQRFDRGFERFVSHQNILEIYGNELFRDLSGISPDKPSWAHAVTDQALELMKDVPADEPYFLWLFYFDPHFLYSPPRPWRDSVEAESCFALYDEFNDQRQKGGQIFADIGGVASRAMEHCRRLYDAEIAYVDEQIARLLAALEEQGRLEDTLILFTADHGENFGEWGLFYEHGDNAHGAGLHVPLIFHGPGVASGRRDAAVTSLVDVVPTVLGLLGVEKEDLDGEAVDGEDLGPRLRPGEPEPAARDRVVFAESASAMWNEAFDLVITGRTWWRVCINGERFTLCEIPKNAPGVYRLYDHEADPDLSRNIAAEHPEIVARLRSAWQNWPYESARQRVAQTARFKLVQFPRLEGGYEAKLFDLETDPEETTDVQEAHPEIHAALLGQLERWAARIPEMPEREMDPELEETLRALGYLR